ncbi:MAG: 50S ribosomal protein L4 [Firmicutes bacterium]|nr:50S ribosomal protein L4 [Bacillota bacterium]
MPTINIYNQKGENKGALDVDVSVFGVEYNEPVIHQVMVAQRSNARQGTKSALTRTEVRGGGIKPWRQKGTGRARQGSIRAPQWIKGGVVFAPKPRDFSQKVNKKVRRLAICSALSAKLFDGDLIAVDEFKFENLKTKEMVAALNALNIEKSVLIVTAEKDDAVIRVSGNIENVSTLSADRINVYDILKNRKCIMTVDAVKRIEEAYRA